MRRKIERVAGHAAARHRACLGVLGALVAALAVVLVATPAWAATTTTITATGSNGVTTGEATASVGSGNGSIVIHLPTPEAGATSSYNYKVYKVFNASIPASAVRGNTQTAYTSFTLVNGNTTVPNITTNGNKFVMDDAGNVYYGTVSDSQTTGDGSFAITVGGQTRYLEVKTGEMTADEASAANAAIRAYLNLSDSDNTNDATPAADVNVARTFSTLKITGLDYGYYYLTTDAGTSIALTSTNPTGEIQSKNDVPSIDKKITKVDDGAASDATTLGSVQSGGKNAIAEVGSTVHYESTIDVKKGAVGYVFKDLMESSLSLNASSIAVQTKIGDGNATTVDASQSSSNTTYVADTTAAENDYTFKITFADSFIQNLENELDKSNIDSVKIIVTYTATVTSDALQEDPATNSATISYGNDQQFTSTPSTTNVYNALLQVKKYACDGNGNATTTAVPGAGFVLARGAGTDESPYTYYKYAPASGSTPAKVEWVSDINKATELYSDNAGTVKSDALSEGFEGLYDGTYTLIEKTVPAGYNKAENQTITINGATGEGALTTANLKKSTNVYDRAGTALPTTGGIGTTVFHVVGGAVVAGAVAYAIYAARRKKNAASE